MVIFIFRSLIHLDLNFVHGDRYVSVFILLHIDIQLRQQHLLKMHSFIHCKIFAFFFQKSGLHRCVLINIWVFDSIPLGQMCLKSRPGEQFK